LDVGKKRIGLAISDELRLTAQGLATYQRVRIRDDLAALRALAHERGVVQLVIGNPLHLSGDDSRQSAYVGEFAARLGQYTGLPVALWDERLTSKQAGRVLRESGISIDKRAKAVDKLSAVLILESYLDAWRDAPPLHADDWGGPGE
jgi:putative Holliday junction resolvase